MADGRGNPASPPSLPAVSRRRREEGKRSRDASTRGPAARRRPARRSRGARPRNTPGAFSPATATGAVCSGRPFSSLPRRVSSAPSGHLPPSFPPLLVIPSQRLRSRSARAQRAATLAVARGWSRAPRTFGVAAQRGGRTSGRRRTTRGDAHAHSPLTSIDFEFHPSTPTVSSAATFPCSPSAGDIPAAVSWPHSRPEDPWSQIRKRKDMVKPERGASRGPR